MAHPQLKGARLAYVVVKLNGKVKRTKHTYDKKSGGIVAKEVEEPAGFLVYFPQGHCIRCRDEKELADIRYQGEPINLEEQAPFASMDGLLDPNSRIGKLMHSQDEKSANRIRGTFEEDVIKLVKARCGEITVEKEVENVGSSA